VDALNHLALEGRPAREGGRYPDRPDIGENAHSFSQSQQPGLAAHLTAQVVPFGSADSPQENRLGRRAGGQRLGRERSPFGVDGSASHTALVQVNLDTGGGAGPLQYGGGLARDLRAD